jgi:methylase of polypeptide subunit release factors
MLSVAEEYLRELNPEAQLEVFGQELNDESFAICKSDMMVKGQNPANIVRGNSFSEDGHHGQKFDYMLSNPPFGVEWKKVENHPAEARRRASAALRGRAAAHQRRVLPLPPAHDRQDEAAPGWRQPAGDRVQRFAAVHRRGGLGRVRDPALDHRERLAGGGGRPAGPALLQHRDQHRF